MDMEEDYLGKTCFFDLVGYGGLWPTASLESVSKQRSSYGPYETDLVRRIEEAWRTPFRDISAEQVRLLLGQRTGLAWLGRPILEFVIRFPQATVTNYAGEMVLLTLRAAEEMKAAARSEFSAWLTGDFSWMDDTFGWDEALRREATSALQAAKFLCAY